MAREQFQTLTEPMYYILLSLTEERYGYEIMQIILERTKERVKIGPGTLYTLLSRFEKEELIKQVSDDGRRKTYLITQNGRGLLLEEYNRLKSLVEDGGRYLFSNTTGEMANNPSSQPTNELYRHPINESSPEPAIKKKKRRDDDILL